MSSKRARVPKRYGKSPLPAFDDLALDRHPGSSQRGGKFVGRQWSARGLLNELVPAQR
jgi:hypothetical protein